TVLATLETIDMRLRLGSAKAERIAYLKQASAAAAEDKTAEQQIALAQAERIAAQIGLLEHEISQATIISPITGIVVTGDLKRQIGAPFKTGDVLFHVAPLESLRGELAVPEGSIPEVELGQEGELAPTGFPERRIRFVVERINPMSEVVERQNVFKVRVRLVESDQQILPGMEGLAKIDIGPRPYGWIWTRELVNWVRMKLWI
ncbi:MAG: efflux RND transporter periplasmic adaptor subunit, partial [Planctomycetota bacterium]|nr:efflux RND transporter periplasmic adaptor subunit [Planctomycetota bacterium]